MCAVPLAPTARSPFFFGIFFLFFLVCRKGGLLLPLNDYLPLSPAPVSSNYSRTVREKAALTGRGRGEGGGGGGHAVGGRAGERKLEGGGHRLSLPPLSASPREPYEVLSY
jgi:hypothetical protein